MHEWEDPVADTPWSPEAVTAALAGHFGLRARTVSGLGGELYQNVAADLDDGTRVVVKIAPAGTDVTHIRWEQELMRLAGAQEALGPVRVPRIHPALDGEGVAVVGHEGGARAVWVQSWLDGRTLADLDGRSERLLEELGATAARMVAALERAPGPPSARGHHWDVLAASASVASEIDAVTEPDRRADVATLLRRYGSALARHGEALPRGVVHQDLNDFNVLVRAGADGRHTVHGVLDFADALHTARVSELVVAVAYAMLRTPDPLTAAAAVVRGYAAHGTLTDGELAVVLPVAAARLCVNVVSWTGRTARDGSAYGVERMKHTWPAIALLARIPVELAEARLREAAGVALPAAAPVTGEWCAVPDLRLAPLGAGAWAAEPDPPAPADATGAVGHHLAPGAVAPVRRTTVTGEAATLRLGVEITAREPFRVLAPLAGTVEDNGPVVAGEGEPAEPVLVLRHGAGGSPAVWSRWSGPACALGAGDEVAAGEPLGSAARTLRVALFPSLEAARLAAPAVVPESQAAAWAAVSPDPLPFLGLPDLAAPRACGGWSGPRVLRSRETHFAKSQRSYYDRPMNLVSGRGSWLYDESGRAYLDAINNVTHVGHSNPRVVRAAAAQMARLNTNSRFVYPGIAQYAERLTSLLPEGLEVAFLVCSGSEANDLAVRMARQVTGRSDVLVVDGAYHGNTAVITGLSPNRYKGPGGTGPAPTTHEVEQPNLYRGRHRYGDPLAAEGYAADVARQVDRLVAGGRPPAAFLAESVMGTAGSLFYPEGYLERAYASVRAAGGLCIADEVQVGFGRLGDVFWGFETQGVRPDIVTMGKPIGNGHPMAAVVTTREIADAFDTGMKYFNTFGGNPVSCAVGTAVLDEIAEEDLQARARATGAHFKEALLAVADRHEIIGDVRGRGMYLGVELVRDRATMEPAGAEAMWISELMKDEGVIVYPTGASNHVLKLKPPLTFTGQDADLFAAAFDEVLSRDW